MFKRPAAAQDDNKAKQKGNEEIAELSRLFLRNRAYYCHLVFLVVRAFALIFSQTKWQLSLELIRQSRKENGKPLHFKFNEDKFDSIVEPTVEILMFSLLSLGVMQYFFLWYKRQAASYLIFGYELLYFLIEHSLPLYYGFYMPFVVAMQLLVIVACFACQTGECVVIVTILYMTVVFVLQPLVMTSPHDLQNSYESIIGVFAVFVAASAILAAYQWAFAHHRPRKTEVKVKESKQDNDLINEMAEGIIMFKPDHEVYFCN